MNAEGLQQGEGSNAGHAAGRADAHVVPYRVFAAVLAGLLALTGITIAIAELDLGRWGVWAALIVASVKSTLVLAWFMHLKYEPPWLRRMFYAAILFLAIAIGGIFLDVSFRT